MATRFGRQPAFAVIYQRGHNLKSVAEAIDVTYGSLRAAVHGRVGPSDEIREHLPRHLKCKLADLFTVESLAAVPGGSRGPKPGWKKSLLEEGRAS